MSVKYTINFINKQASKNDYIVCVQPPNGNYATSVWRKEVVAPQGNFEIVLTPDIYAWVGTAPEKVSPGVVISRGQGLLAKLGSDTQKGSTFNAKIAEGNIEIAESKPPQAGIGEYQIVVPSYQPDGKNYLLGMAQVDNHDIPTPVASIAATPNLTQNVKPIYKFYIAQRKGEVREVVDFEGISTKSGIVDFSSGPGLTQHVATVYHRDDGSFETKYSYTYV